MLASLGIFKRELALGRVVPVLRESWMQSNWAFMKLRRRSPSPAAIAFLAMLRAAQAATVAEDARLEQRWRAQLPPRAGPGKASATGRRRKPAG
jgi:hypothetical protein